MKYEHLDPLPEADVVAWCRNQISGSGNSYTARLAVRILKIIRERDDVVRVDAGRREGAAGSRADD